MTQIQPSDLTLDQRMALEAITDWYTGTLLGGYGTPQTLTLGGYAGTGKTTILGLLSTQLRGRNIAFVSYTGKAVSVLASKLPPGSHVSTIHRLLYHPHPINVCKRSGMPMLGYIPGTGGSVITSTPPTYCTEHAPNPDDPKRAQIPPCETIRKLEWSHKDNPLRGYDLVVADEASMIGDKVWRDLTSWGVPVLAVGDHGQLPPVKSESNLMADPDIRLEKIHRQVADSPIIRMSIMARVDGHIPIGEYGPAAIKVPFSQMDQFEITPEDGDLVIVGYNKTRNAINDQMREQHDRVGPPTEGDRVICLRNDYNAGVFNGMLGWIRNVGEAVGPYQFMTIEMADDDTEYSGEVATAQFGAPKTLSDVPRFATLWDYGYALTCHKAQGSQADKVMVIEEFLPQTDRRRWLYTAVTRAAKELIVVGK